MRPAIGPHAGALCVGFREPVGNAALDAPELRMSITTGPTYIQGAVFRESISTDSLRGRRGGELRAARLGRFRERGGAEHTLEVISRADPHGVAGFGPKSASTRAEDLAP
ncbi:hypothetical protein ABTX85_36045 [Streptomyces sp. NPDC096097]|uniref:hypothetical protein n=1 Tax=Streptomyces sp. NPDC096097 TaxID=3155546 RepID=UPI00331D27D4